MMATLIWQLSVKCEEKDCFMWKEQKGEIHAIQNWRPSSHSSEWIFVTKEVNKQSWTSVTYLIEFIVDHSLNFCLNWLCLSLSLYVYNNDNNNM